jgi:transposase
MIWCRSIFTLGGERRAPMGRMEARGQAAFVSVMIDESRRDLPVLPVSGVEIGIDVCGLTLRIPDGVSADHIGRVLSAVREVR